MPQAIRNHRSVERWLILGHPSEVEAAIGAHPKVKDVAVIGVPHEKWGKSVAVVVPHQEATLSDDDRSSRMTISPDSVAGVIAKSLKVRGNQHVFALCGGHIMPLWMRLDAEGIRIIDVRDERSAVHMAQAHRDNRRGAVEISASVPETLRAVIEAAGNRAPALDKDWAAKLRAGHTAWAAKLKAGMAQSPAGKDGRLHPNKVLSELQNAMPEDAIVITDGGDFLAFARVGLSAERMLDPGPFGCIGVGVPYGVAAALAFPGRTVLVATGDGAVGFNAMELDTAVRHQAPVLFAVANNGAWAIEVHDQTVTHGKVVGTRLRFSDYAGMARALGLHAERVETEEQIPGAIARALANRPALIDFVVTPEAISSDGKTGLAWVPDLQPPGAWDEAERAWRAGGGIT